MDYCISDIHGHYDLFCRLMDRIDFCQGDRLFVAGDILEKGPDSIRLAKLLYSMSDVYCIAGNHEYDFLRYFHSLMRDTDDYDLVLSKLRSYFSDGDLLDWDIVDFLEGLPYYLKTDRFLMVHAGLPVKGGKALRPEDTPERTLVCDRTFKEPDVLPEGGKCVFFGHTPTWYLTGGKYEILFYPRKGAPSNSTDVNDYYKIHLDLDTALSGVLGCVSVDTCEAFYVKRCD